MRVIIAGCGRVGAQLAILLSYEGHNVVVIDKDPGAFHRLESPFNGLTLTGIAFDEELLKEAGIEKADAFASLTNYDNTNLMAAEIAADLFGVPTVIARVYNPDKEPTYRRMGIDYLCGSTMLAETFHRAVTAGVTRLHLDKGDGLQVMELDLGPEGGGQTISELRSLEKGRLLALIRDGKPMFFSRDTRLREGDSVLLAVDARDGAYLERLLPVARERYRPRGRMERTWNQEEEDVGREPAWRTIVAGCGRVGTQLAEMLSFDGHHVVVIDKNREALSQLSKTFHGEVFEGMAFDMDILEEAGVKEANAFIAVTNYDNTNLMAAEVARSIYGVDRVISRLYNPDKGSTYQALGIDYICGTSLLAEEFLLKIVHPKLVVKAWTANNQVMLVEFECPSKYGGKKVQRLEKEELLRVGLVIRGMKTMVASRETVLKKGDTITAAVLAPRIHKIRKLVG
jgi:trk system potassium uptake protein TrkA